MIFVGITGGIGSGKSAVCECFKTFGAPVYDSDSRAKQLMDSSLEILSMLRLSFGDEIFKGEKLDRAKLASIVFADAQRLAELNSIVHPVVLDDFECWANSLNTPYVIMESAILIDSGFHDFMNITIGVIAPLDERVERVIKRDNCTADQVLSRINMQLPDSSIVQFCEEIIYCSNQDDLYSQVKELDESIRYAAAKHLS